MRRRKGVLLLLVVGLIVGFLTLANAQDSINNSGSDSAKGSADNVDRNDKNPCSFRGNFVYHEDSIRLGPCTFCTCDNATTTCEIESCPADGACSPSEIVVIEAECCPQCPYKMYVKGTNNLYANLFDFSEGESKKIKFDLDIEIYRKRTSRRVRGEGLWKLSAWISSNSDGTGTQYSYQSNLFTEKNANQQYYKPQYPPWVWNRLKYNMEFKGGSCDDYKFFCVKFNEGDNPRPAYDLSFTFQAVDDDEFRLVSCVPLGQCSVGRNDNNPCSFRGNILYHEDSIRLDPCTLCTCNDATTTCEIESCPADGACSPSECCPQCHYIDRNDNNPCSFRGNILYHEDSIRLDPCTLCTCNNATTTCEIESCPADGACSPSECCPQCHYSLIATALTWNIEATDPQLGTPTTVTVDVAIDFTADSANKKGEGLWRITLFGSSNEDGSGARYSEIRQTLNEGNAATAKNSEVLSIDDITILFDIGSVGCSHVVSYVCVEFSQGDDPDPPFTMTIDSRSGDSSEDSIIGCKQEACYARAVFRTLVPDMIGEVSFIENIPTNQVRVNLDAITDKNLSTSVQGRSLWEVSTFFNVRANGKGPRMQEQRQILHPPQQDLDLSENDDLEFLGIVFNADLTGLVCSDIPFVCFELNKNSDSTINYSFSTNPTQDPFVECVDFSKYCRGTL